MHTVDHFNRIKPFLSETQFAYLAEAAIGEEGDFFSGQIIQLAQQLSDAPTTYQQDGLGDMAIAHFHYFLGGSDWFITELDMDGGVDQAFGLAVLNGDWIFAELGYISIRELVSIGAELDLYWQPRTLGAIKEQAHAE